MLVKRYHPKVEADNRYQRNQYGFSAMYKNSTGTYRSLIAMLKAFRLLQIAGQNSSIHQ